MEHVTDTQIHLCLGSDDNLRTVWLAVMQQHGHRLLGLPPSSLYKEKPCRNHTNTRFLNYNLTFYWRLPHTVIILVSTVDV